MGDRKIIIVLSGEICTGKTTLADSLEKDFGFLRCKTREGLTFFADKALDGKQPDRGFLQKFGEKLDNDEDGKWVLDYFQHLYHKDFDKNNFYLIDSARILKQIRHIRKAYNYSVYHIHLTASPSTLMGRFYRRGEINILPTEEQKARYERYKADPTEYQVDTLGPEADLAIDTDRCTTADVLIRVASYFRLLPPTWNELVDVIVGGQFGSEGKGQIAAHIAPEYDCLVRVGGPNAGHTVYQEPNKHVFHLLPSGTYRSPHAKLLIGPGAVLNLDKILEEIRTYGVEVGRLVIDENAVIISQEDIDREQEIKDRISSTGQGVGMATAGNIISRLLNENSHKAKHFNNELRGFLGSTGEELERLYAQGKKILLEGTQGMGLSLHHGMYPHVTSRDTSVSGTLSEAGISPRRVRRIIMVTRTYPIRVGGTSGDFQSVELTMEVVAERAGIDPEELLSREITTTTKKPRRIAEFSWSLFRRACEINSPTDIGLTFTDYISVSNVGVRHYDNLTPETRRMIEEIESCSGVKVSLIGTTFDYRAVIDRRNWI